MQEPSVSVAGTTYDVESPYIVLATQNPSEHEGGSPLPEAQLDRFIFKLKVFFPSASELTEIITRTTSGLAEQPEKVLSGEDIMQLRRLVREVPIAPHVLEYVVQLVLGTHPDSEFATADVKQYVRQGASPRGAQAIVLTAKVKALLEGRTHVAMEDVDLVALPALRHRLILNFEGLADGVSPDNIILELLERKEVESV
jgi:MoxR-like ATPase